MPKLCVICLLADGFEDSEFRVPYDRLRNAGVEVDIVGAKAGATLKGYKGKESIRTDRSIEEVRPDEYTAMLIPGGLSPDHLRADERFVAFVRAFEATGAPIAAVCHGPQLLMSAELVRGRALTAWKTVQSDLRQMGAIVHDEPVVIDNNWITSRQPSDLDAFSAAFLHALGVEDRGAGEHAAPDGAQAQRLKREAAKEDDADRAGRTAR